jgi:acyl-CoA thioesterase
MAEALLAARQAVSDDPLAHATAHSFLSLGA